MKETHLIRLALFLMRFLHSAFTHRYRPTIDEQILKQIIENLECKGGVDEN